MLTAIKSVSVAMDAVESGRMMRKKMPKYEQPSILAASSSSPGMP